MVNIPLITSDAYLTLWKRFITAFSNKYKKESRISSIHISGCGIAGELTLRAASLISDPDWAAIGVTDAFVVESWKKLIPHYVSCLGTKALCSPGVTPFMTKLGDRTGVQLFCDWILANYREKIGIYNHGLQEGGPSSLIKDIIKASAPQSGYQALGGFLPGGWLYPNSGNPSVAFQQPADDGVTSVEIYQNDLIQNNLAFEALVQE